MNPILALVLFVASVVLIMRGIKLDAERSKKLKTIRDNREEVKVKQQLSNLDIKELEVFDGPDGLMFRLSLRMLSFVNENEISFTARALMDDATVGFRINILKEPSAIKLVDSDEKETVYT